MLKTMRKNVKSLAPILWVVIAAFVVAIFAVWGGAGRLGEKAGTATIATIGKEKISTEAYFTILRQRLESLQREFKGLNRSLIQQLNIPHQVLEQMIQQSLLLQQAKALGIEVTNRELRGKIVSLFQRDGKFIGYEEYRRIIEWNRMSVAQFEDNLKRDILLEKILDFLTAGIVVSPEELWETYKKQNETARLEYLLLDENKIVLPQEVRASEVQDYFEANKDNYHIPERREGAYIILETEELKKQIQLSEAEVEKYYRNNLNQFKEPEKTRVSRIYLPFSDREKSSVQKEAQHLRERISRGEDFAQLAQSASRDEKASSGGDWGYYEWRNLSTEEREEIDQLGPGEVSGVVEMKEGLSILKVTEKEPEKTLPLEQVKTRIRTILEDEKARKLAEERIAALEKSALKEKSLDVASQKAGLKVKSTGLLKLGQSLGELDPSGTISQALFRLKEKEISTLHTLSGVGIVQLEKIEAERPARFEEVHEEVEKDLLNRRKKELALEQIKKIRAQVEGKDWEDIAPKLGVEHKSVNEHRRDQYVAVLGENPEVDRLAFSLPLNQVSEPIEYSGGYALLRVLERKETAREDFEKEAEAERSNLLETKKDKFLRAYLSRLREEKGVKINTSLFLQINADILSRFEERE